MIYSILEYAEIFRFKGKKVSAMTIKRRCEKGQLPSGHHAKKLHGKTGDWVIEVPDEILEPKVIKTKPEEPDKKSLSRKYFNFR